MDALEAWLIAFVSSENNVLGLFVLAASALIEYVFPPFPGDTITLFGAVLVTAYGWSFWGVFGAVMAGAMVGSMAAFYAGGVWQRRRDRTPANAARQRRLLDDLVVRFRRHGGKYLVLNRFLPGFRTLFFVAAGMARMRPLTVLIYAAISAAAWNLCVMGAGGLIGANFDRLKDLMRSYMFGVWGVIGLIALALIGRALWRRRRRRASANPDGDDS